MGLRRRRRTRLSGREGRCPACTATYGGKPGTGQLIFSGPTVRSFENIFHFTPFSYSEQIKLIVSQDIHLYQKILYVAKVLIVATSIIGFNTALDGFWSTVEVNGTETGRNGSGTGKMLSRFAQNGSRFLPFVLFRYYR